MPDMEPLGRPSTAPCAKHRRPRPEQWFEVDDVVRKMLFNAASTATSSTAVADALPQRPHTACAGARASVVVLDARASDSESESDGASFDGDETTEVASAQSTPTGRQATAATVKLSREQELLLGGALWGRRLAPAGATRRGAGRPEPQASATSSAGTTSTPAAAGEARPSRASAGGYPAQQSSARSGPGSGYPGRGSGAKVAVPALGEAAGKKLPRQCMFLASGGGSAGAAALGGGRPSTGQGRPSTGGQRVAGMMAPTAARFKSHCSWQSYQPVSTPGASRPPAVEKAPSGAAGSATAAPAAAPPTVAGAIAGAVAAASGAADEAAAAAIPVSEAPPPTTVEKAAAAAATAAATGPEAGAGVGGALCEEPSQGPRRRGPKYKVTPGGSRPASKAPREIVVLEFRTEPRVVPASRTSREGLTKRIGGGGKEARKEAIRFRPDSRAWAREREALAGTSN